MPVEIAAGSKPIHADNAVISIGRIRLDEEHQQAAKEKAVQDGVGGDRHQAGAIVVGLDLDAGGQSAVAIDLLDLGLDACDHLIGLQGPVHHHDGGDHVVFVVAAGFAQPWREADLDHGDRC
ncbi:hypothetical protein CS8_004320 [Cupriavidus sp. 8B]